MASAQALLAEKKAGTNARWQTQRARGAGFLGEQRCDGRGDGAGVVAAGEAGGRDERDADGTEPAQAATAAAASTQAAAARAIAGILATTSTKRIITHRGRPMREPFARKGRPCDDSNR
jgi:hypothetical protein